MAKKVMHQNSLDNMKKKKDFGSPGGPDPVEAAKRANKKKQERKTLKEELLLLLNSPDVQKRMCTALIKEATEGNNAGSVRAAFETIMKAIGEEPESKIALDGVKFTFGDGGEDFSG